MANRKRKGRPVFGWLILDKPAGMSSTQTVATVKRLFRAQKAGHAGTLDPLASGCLPIALGEATKTMSQMLEAGKTYRFTISWGVETNTDDTEGRPVATSQTRPDRPAIEAAIPEFEGEIEQVPPSFSAVKIHGERAYNLAREGERPELPPRQVTIDRFELIATPDPDHSIFEIDCGKGTYVRSLARDLGRLLGTFGHVSELRRLNVGPFPEDEMVPLGSLRIAAEEGPEACDALLLPVEAALSELPRISLHNNDINSVLRGQSVLLRGAEIPTPGPAYASGGGRLLAIGAIDAGSFQPKRVFHL